MKTLKYFSAAWCGPCKSFKPIMTDIDQSETLARKYNVMSVPTVVIEENGIELSRFIGTKPKQAILESIA